MWKNKIILLFSLLFILSSYSISQVLYWQRLGDFHFVFDVKTNSYNDIFICVQNDYGVKRSTDKGITWQSLNGIEHYISRLAINKSDEIFAASDMGGGIFKSTDNGETWINVFSLKGFYRSLEISKEGYIFAGNENGLLIKSFDDGNTWMIDTVSNVPINTIVYCSNGQLFLGTEGESVFTSTDYGETWSQLQSQYLSNDVNCMTVNYTDCLFATNFNGISISTDYGTSWIYRNTINDTYSGELASDSVGNIFFGYTGLYRSEDFCFTWEYLGTSSRIYKIFIKNKKIFLATSGGLFRYDPDIIPYIGNNYLPLNVGNQWQFLEFQDDTGIYSYSLSNYKIMQDTMFNANHYFLWGNKWIRYCDSTKLITLWNNNTEKVYMNFNLPEGAIFTQFNGYIYRDVSVFERDQQGYQSKGFYFDTTTSSIDWEIKTFAENLGFFYLENGYQAITHFYGVSTSDLIMAILYDSLGNQNLFTGHYKPLFIISPIHSINQSNFEFNFKVEHYYSHFFDPGTPFNGLNFIDSVLMYRYYSNGDSIINLDPFIPYNDGQSPDYSVNFELDSTLMKNGFNFYYRFYANDKGIIPEHSSSPDSGYYECVWDIPNRISKNEKSISYTLKQNFPNPFNPITTINYSLSKSSWVSLEIFDILGKKLKTLINEQENSGNYRIIFDASEFPSGIYFYTLKAVDFIQTRKMVLLK